MSLLPRRSTIKSGVDEAVETLNGIRGDEQVDLFWTKVTTKAGAVDVGEHMRYLEEEKRPFDLIIYAVRRWLPGNNFDKEQIPTAAVGR